MRGRGEAFWSERPVCQTKADQLRGGGRREFRCQRLGTIVVIVIGTSRYSHPTLWALLSQCSSDRLARGTERRSIKKVFSFAVSDTGKFKYGLAKTDLERTVWACNLSIGSFTLHQLNSMAVRSRWIRPGTVFGFDRFQDPSPLRKGMCRTLITAAKVCDRPLRPGELFG